MTTHGFAKKDLQIWNGSQLECSSYVGSMDPTELLKLVTFQITSKLQTTSHFILLTHVVMHIASSLRICPNLHVFPLKSHSDGDPHPPSTKRTTWTMCTCANVYVCVCVCAVGTRKSVPNSESLLPVSQCPRRRPRCVTLYRRRATIFRGILSRFELLTVGCVPSFRRPCHGLLSAQ